MKSNKTHTGCNKTLAVDQIGFYSDVTANSLLGYGAILGDNSIFGQWEPWFVVKQKPSIEFLEVFHPLCRSFYLELEFGMY